VLSLKLGVIELIEKAIGDNIVILLDDVDSELDPHRSKRLFSMLFQSQRQLIVTGTREPASDFPYASVFEVESGNLRTEAPLRAF
jgi:recombinational DNA repair ATPase RecF